MDNSVAQTTELMTHLRFTAADLAANRAGEFSEAQEARMRQEQSRLLLLGSGSFIAVVFIATIFLFIGQRNQTLVLSLIGVLLTLANALWVGTLARQWMRLNADLRENRAEVLEGPLERVLRPTRYGQNYLVRLEGHIFAVDKDTFKAFVHDAPYRFYRAPHTHTLLSVELLSR